MKKLFHSLDPRYFQIIHNQLLNVPGFVINNYKPFILSLILNFKFCLIVFF